MLRFIVLLLGVLFLPQLSQAQREKWPLRDLIVVERKFPEAERTSTGLWTEVLKEGSGAKPSRGDSVKVLFKGMLLDGTTFDEVSDPSKAFTFQLDRGKVIAGWEYGLLMMREGERRLLIVPYELGYGTRGRSPDIPRMATLIFEVELLEVIPRPPLGS